MKRISRAVILIVSLGLLLPGTSGRLSSVNPAAAVDEVVFFEMRAGLMGRSELYALEQLRLVGEHPNKVELGIVL